MSGVSCVPALGDCLFQNTDYRLASPSNQNLHPNFTAPLCILEITTAIPHLTRLALWMSFVPRRRFGGSRVGRARKNSRSFIQNIPTPTHSTNTPLLEHMTDTRDPSQHSHRVAWASLQLCVAASYPKRIWMLSTKYMKGAQVAGSQPATAQPWARVALTLVSYTRAVNLTAHEACSCHSHWY